MKVKWPKNLKTRIKCKVCGKWFKAINSAHLLRHGYEGTNPVEEYKSDYGLNRATSEATRKKLGSYHIGNEHWVGRKHSIKSIKKMSKSQKGVKQSLKARNKIRKANLGNKRALGYKHNKSFKIKVSKFHKKLWLKRKKDLRYKQYSIIKDIVISKGGTILSDKYVGSTTPIRVMCKNNHIFTPIPSNLKRGSWCRQCYLIDYYYSKRTN